MNDLKRDGRKNNGGKRANAGTTPKSADGVRSQMSVNLSPDNYAFLQSKGKGKNDYLNYLLEKEREKEQEK